ncbi:Glyoxylase, beta-lactamase superfamily II [Thermosyntropha lipolytica DSM 11003]|uniref:Glyoxylase, beta-lactamase superfamily II n=1 Tax=Thermosyntropha lipolytica DSM 11003 TaxID=1123382 RepID=A0A1M5MUY9_9FIRM|nr:MBL fold metallo-hydrolase [Thermosyntropha lipolytica]SHG80719.1 Glyoxylase, beta-lactamase superfamily II [Thermosyntropha lipolytica DSM 11003]
MKLEQVAGNTYYINFPSLIGVYVFPDGGCLLIDSGASSAFAQKAKKVLDDEGLRVEAIFNTHAHADHSGGNRFWQEAYGCDIYATPFEAAFMENALLGPFCLYTASPVDMLRNKFLMPEPSQVTHRIRPGDLIIKETGFKVLDLAGHAMEQAGLVTPDGVLFSGDAIITEHNLDKFPFVYMADLEKHMTTLQYLKENIYPYTVVGHGGILEQVEQTLSKNEEIIKHILAVIEKFILSPRSREEIVAHVIKEMALPDNRNQYILISGTISAYLAYLCNNKKARIFTEENNLKWVLAKR